MILRFFSLSAAPFLLASCISSHDQLWHGSQTPLAGTCDPAAPATLSIRRKTVAFTPGDGVVTLPGTAAGEVLTARLNTAAPNHTPYVLRFTGRLTGTAVVGVFETPRCRYAVTLTPSRE